MIKVATINTFANNGGAANAAFRTHLGFLKHPNIHPFYIVHNKGNCSDNMTFEIKTRKGRVTRYINSLFQKLYIVNNRTPISSTMFSTHFTYNDISKTRWIQEADIINLHWIENFLSLGNIEQLAKTGKPLLWTLHDERAYTGGCHYTAGCEEFLKDCNKCKQLQWDPFKYPSKVLKRKYDILSQANFTVVATSNWQYQKVKESSLFKDMRVELISNSVDVGKYAPQDKEKLKEKYGIEKDVITLQFGAHNVNDIRKGYIYLKEALEICLKDSKFKQMCDDSKILILKLGKTDNRDEKLPIATKEFGLIRDNDKLIELYNTTDVFILPSLEDNLPYSMVESMSCGVPVIAFDTGGISDIIEPSLNLLVKQRDAEGLAQKILELVFDEEKRNLLSHKSREIIRSKCTFELQANRYYDLYQDLLRGRE